MCSPSRSTRVPIQNASAVGTGAMMSGMMRDIPRSAAAVSRTFSRLASSELTHEHRVYPADRRTRVVAVARGFGGGGGCRSIEQDCGALIDAPGHGTAAHLFFQHHPDLQCRCCVQLPGECCGLAALYVQRFCPCGGRSDCMAASTRRKPHVLLGSQ